MPPHAAVPVLAAMPALHGMVVQLPVAPHVLALPAPPLPPPATIEDASFSDDSDVDTT